MKLLLFNTGWMLFNLFLAFVGLSLSFMAFKEKRKTLKIFYLVWAILFVPNTIYIVTDLAHIQKNWPRIQDILKPLLLIQYLLFVAGGFITFLLSIAYLEKVLEKFFKFSRRHRAASLILLNFLISFGVVIGRAQRANSWHVITKPLLVYENVIRTLQSRELMIYVVVFGLFLNIFYFAFSWSKKGVGERT